jgi:hypothetical protein
MYLGNPKMTSTNCVLNKKELKEVFFDRDSENGVDEYNAMYGGGKYV